MLRMLDHLHTGGPAPADYIDLMLCRTYGCLPDQLDQQDGARIARHLTCITAESRAARR